MCHRNWASSLSPLALVLGPASLFLPHHFAYSRPSVGIITSGEGVCQVSKRINGPLSVRQAGERFVVLERALGLNKIAVPQHWSVLTGDHLTNVGGEP